MSQAPRNARGQYLKGYTGNPRGPITKSIDSKGLARLTQLSARGVREIDLMRAVDMSKPTWYAYKRNHPEVEEAIAAGRQQMHDSLIGKLYEKAMGGDTIALIYATKALLGYSEGTNPAESRPQITINLPGAASLEDFKGLTINGDDDAPKLPAKQVRRG